MPSLAVQITELGSSHPKVYQGVLTKQPQVGEHCTVYLGSKRFLRIARIKGWIGSLGGGRVILFDKNGNRFRVEVTATSDEFLL